MLLGELKRVLPNATWTGAGIGPNQARVMDWILARNADGVRTGLEDNIRITRDRLAKSNAELVAIAAEKISKYNRRHARPEEARKLLHLGVLTPACCASSVSFSSRNAARSAP
jgi:3-keto-5-aminohexanoate cleavage enzyme